MRIDNITRVYETYSSQKISTPLKTEKGQERDQVAFSLAAQEYGKVKQLLEQVPEVREEKVAALKQAIASGTYQVSGREIVDKMITQIDIKG